MVVTERREATKGERIVTVNRMPKHKSRTKKYKKKNRNCTYKKRIRGGAFLNKAAKTLSRTAPVLLTKRGKFTHYLPYITNQYGPQIIKGISEFKKSGNQLAQEFPELLKKSGNQIVQELPEFSTKVKKGVIEGVLNSGNDYLRQYALTPEERNQYIGEPKKRVVDKLYTNLQSKIQNQSSQQFNQAI